MVTAFLTLYGCGEKPATMDDFNVRDLKLPGGQIIQVQAMLDVKDMLRGMMFRTSLAPDRGMLFIHRGPGNYPYWMYQTPLSLDMIWMDTAKRVVEIVPEAPPCTTEASKCPHFGGHEKAQFVLELRGGMAKKYGIQPGDYISF